MVGLNEIKNFLRNRNVVFIVANIGFTIKRIPDEETFSFWENEVKIRLVEPEQAISGFYLESFPGEYCYIAYEYLPVLKNSSSKKYIILKVYH